MKQAYAGRSDLGPGEEGEKPKRRRWTNPELNRASELWFQGLTVKEIARELDRTDNSVQYWVENDRDRFPRRRPYNSGLHVTGHKPHFMKLSITAELRHRLEQSAKERGVSMNTLIRDAVRKELMPDKYGTRCKCGLRDEDGRVNE